MFCIKGTIYWEQRKFSELYELVNEKNDGSYGKDSNITVATMQFKSNIQISKNEYLNTYNIFKKGYIAFEGHKSKEFRFGRFVENDIGDGIVSHIFIVFRPIMEFDINFWKYAINNELIMQSILSRSTKASTMMNDLVVKDFLKEIFFVPFLGEQACIGKTLKSLDHLITLHQSKYFRHILKAITSCTLYWEQRKVNEIIEDYIEKTTVQNQYTVLTSSQQKGIVYQEEYFSDRQVTTNANIGYYVLPRGYFTYRSRSDTNVFVFNRNDIIDKGIISYYYPVFLNKNSDSNFLLRRLNNGVERQITMAAEGTGQHVLSHSKFKNIDIFVPYLDEQKCIGKYFESIDKLITLHQLEPFQLIFKAIAYRIIDYTKSKPPSHRK